MEDLKKDFILYLKSNKKISDLHTKKESLDSDFWKNHYQVSEYLKEHTFKEAEEHFKKDKEKNESLKKAMEDLEIERKKESLKNNLLLNNFIYNFINKYDIKFINIINKYNNKNIGEKTKQKIQDEIKETIKEDIFKNSEIYIYFSGDFSNYEISIEIREKQNEKFIFDIKYKLQKKTSFNCYENETKTFYYRYLTSDFSYNYASINDLLYIENITKAINEILKEETKNKKLMEEQTKKLKDNVKKYNNFIASYNLNETLKNNYKLNYTINLY